MLPPVVAGAGLLSFQGKTRTITLSIYSVLESNLVPALALSAVMGPLSFAVLLVVRVLAASREQPS